MALDWSQGYSCQWHAYEVVPGTWADGAELNEVESASVERSYDGDAPLIESGEIRLRASIGSEWDERYLRLVMVAEQGGERERVEVCTFLCSTTSGEVNHGIDSLRITGRSVLWPASKSRVSLGSYAPAGSDGAALAARLLREVTAAPVVVDGSFELASHIVYDIGESVLSVVWKLLNAGGFGIRISGDGTILLRAIPTEATLQLDWAHARLMHGSQALPHEFDLSGIPNRYVAMDDTEVAEAVNDNPNSPVSVSRRGYRYDEIDTSPIRIGGETLSAYCARKLEEKSIVRDMREWSREWWPDVLPNDIVRASLSSVGVEGDFRVTKQSLTCGRGIKVDEQAGREVYLWSRT